MEVICQQVTLNSSRCIGLSSFCYVPVFRPDSEEAPYHLDDTQQWTQQPKQPHNAMCKATKSHGSKVTVTQGTGVCIRFENKCHQFWHGQAAV